ncbi:FIG028593: membrane protein [hydrothermal vent metagenome]|uniref:FIG028593: membrane protein n=1 Tax=hydrothermal vent metagenome TaxID=652676 RepID=A0A3B1DJ32_9ZZZZ
MSNAANPPRKISEYIKIVFKGFCMGTADVIPGVSGGTLAFLLGIYEELIQSIRSFNIKFVQRLCKLQFKEAFDNVGWKFLGTLVFGILCAIVSLAKLITWLLTDKPILVNAFFFGLIFATIFVIGRIIKKRTPSKMMAIVVSAAAMYFLVGMVPVETPTAAWFLFLCGAIAISAMILPGISGSFILVLLGKYQFILEAVHERNLFVIAVVGLGIVCGIVTFVRILGVLFDRYHDLTVSILTGIVIGSLRKIWPWKETLRTIEGSHGEMIPIEQINILPAQIDGELMGAMVLMIIGFVLAMVLNKSPNQGLLSK